MKTHFSFKHLLFLGGAVLYSLQSSAVSRVRETYRWDMRIRNGEESVSLEDLAGPQLEKILETIEHGDKDKPQSYELDYGRMEQAFAHG